MLKEGDLAPQFNLPGDDGQTHSLKDYLSKWVILYFYPQDLTPGCTTEACEFNESLDQIDDEDIVILGVSKDTLASHARFKGKYNLRFLLLSDVDLSVHKNYGAYGEKINYGKTSMGVIRSTFLIDRKGKIAKVWYKVRVDGHVKTVIKTCRERDSNPHGVHPGDFKSPASTVPPSRQ